jgi:hypothetical protein
MQIGKPKRIYTIEPIEDPVPKLPAEDPDHTSEPRPLEPVEGAPRRP